MARILNIIGANIQQDARKQSLGGAATTITSLDVELKGPIVVEENEARIVTPAPNREMDPGQLSTIRMSFGVIPVSPAREPQANEPK